MTPSILVSSVILVLLLSPATPDPIDPSVLDLTNRNADFGTQLYRALASRTDDNILLSPFTLSTGLLALLSAADGPTRDQLLQGLSLTGLDPQTLPDLFQTLKNVVVRGNLQQGAALLPPQNVQMSSSYQDLVQTKFGGTVQSVSYAAPHEAVDLINRWAQEQTRDGVSELVSNLDPQSQVLLATVTSYQTIFSTSFNSSSSQLERFFVDNYHVVMVPMMLNADRYFLLYDGSLKVGVLQLPLNDGAAMLALLPDEEVDISTIEEELTAELIQSWIRRLKKTRLEVQLPRFLLERSYSLKDFLQTLNITQVFQDDADLSNMGGAKGPKLTQVYQKSRLSVDETTDDINAGGGVTFSTPPPRLTFNRPFIFIIYQQTTNSLLLLGRVTDPTRK